MSHDDIFADLFDEIDTCGDNSCEIKKTRGPGTNGGCMCSERQLRRALRIAKKRIVELETQPPWLLVTEAVRSISDAIHVALVDGHVVSDLTVRSHPGGWDLVDTAGKVLASGHLSPQE
jgi:hypothetical protein